MNKDISNIYKTYINILENTDISNNMSGKDVSTKYTTDNNARFLPIGQDMDEEEKHPGKRSDAIKKKISHMFSKLKSLVERADDKSCTSKDISTLISFIDSPEVRGDIQELLQAYQLEEQENGVNSQISS